MQENVEKILDIIVVKRDGKKVNFNGAKIALAIKKGFDSIPSEDEDLEADLATKTVDELKALCEKKGIDTKKITKKSDLVEALMGAKD